MGIYGEVESAQEVELWMESYVVLSLLERGSISAEELAEFTARCKEENPKGTVLTVSEAADVILHIVTTCGFFNVVDGREENPIDD